MKKHILNVAILATMVVVGCTNSLPEALPQANNSERVIAESPYNEAFDGVAQTVSKAMVLSSDFRQVVKDLSLQKFDGDYDIMLGTLGEQTVSDYTSTKGLTGPITVAQMFDELFPADTKTLSPEEILATLAEMYPLMQIAVPVHAEDWEPGYIPTVVFLDDNYVDTVTEYVKGYNADGEEVWVDAINEPDMPVIVISENERMGLSIEEQQEKIESIARTHTQPASRVSPLDSLNNGFIPIIGPIQIVDPGFQIPSLTATTINDNVSSYIKLTWTLSSEGTPPTGFYVYRKAVGELSFTKIATLQGIVNRSYYDIHYMPLQTYEYYVASMSSSELGVTKSDIVSCVAPSRPNPVSGFESVPINLTRLQLEWNSPSSYIDSMVISRLEINDPNANYHNVYAVTSPQSTANYYIDNITPGQKYIYTAANYANGIPSVLVKDIFYAPYRAVHSTEDIFVNKVGYTCDTKTLEGVLKGAPEFYISVYNADSSYNVTNTGASDRVVFAFDNRTKEQVFSGRRLLSWLPGTDSWMDCVTLVAAEYDYSDQYDSPVSIPIMMNIKITDEISITLGSENTYYEFNPRRHDATCGQVNVNYFDELTRRYTFSSNGFYIEIDNQ